MKKYKAVYLAAIGGAGAFTVKSIKKSGVTACEELGAEAVRRIKVEDFPVTVVFSLGLTTLCLKVDEP